MHFKKRKQNEEQCGLVVTRKLRTLLYRLGITRAGLHAFRHGNETVMDRTKTPVAVRLSRLGHVDTGMMVNYSHVINEHYRAVEEHFGKRFCAELR